MDKYIVISTNNNPDYYFYAKYQERAWNNFGWKLCILVTHDVKVEDLELSNPSTVVCRLTEIPKLRDATIAQASRLYAANYLPLDSLIMTCDMDLIPLSNYWKPNPENITVYGHDLTDFTYFPMGYVAMMGQQWKEKLKCTYNTSEDILRDAIEFKIALSDKWAEWWNHDWSVLTARLKPFKNEITFINRGRGHSGFAYGRVDRGDSMVIPLGETLIDAHCENNNTREKDKLKKFINLFEKAHGKI